LSAEAGTLGPKRFHLNRRFGLDPREQRVEHPRPERLIRERGKNSRIGRCNRQRESVRAYAGPPPPSAALINAFALSGASGESLDASTTIRAPEQSGQKVARSGLVSSCSTRTVFGDELTPLLSPCIHAGSKLLAYDPKLGSGPAERFGFGTRQQCAFEVRPAGLTSPTHAVNSPAEFAAVCA